MNELQSLFYTGQYIDRTWEQMKLRHYVDIVLVQILEVRQENHFGKSITFHWVHGSGVLFRLVCSRIID